MTNIAKRFIYGTDAPNGGYYFDIGPKNIYQFLNNSTQRKKIPEYQRPYSWKESHVLTFLNDIKRVVQGEVEDRAWFIGCIYTTKDTAQDQFSYILDGQQRLTTLQLILREFTLCKIWDEDTDWNLDEMSEVSEHMTDLINECNECLLVNTGTGTKVPRFETEPESSKILNQYITEFRNIKSKQQLAEKVKEFDRMDFETKTSETIQNHIKTIRKYFRDEFKGISSDRYESICEFMRCLLYNFWLIEIPLRQLDYSVEIFEGLNNRGKALTLVDKLQFKSLTVEGFNRTRIRKLWKRTFKSIETNSFFASEEEFFKTFFLAYRGDEESNEEKLIEEFKDVWLVSEDKVESFFHAVETNLKFFDCIHDPLGMGNEFVSAFDSSKKDSVRSTLQVVRVCLSLSKNTRQLIIHLNSKYDPFSKDTNYSQIIGLLNVVRFIFYKEIIEGAKSNSVRSDINKIVSEIDKPNPENSVGLNYLNLIMGILKSEIDITLDNLREENGRLQVKLTNPLSNSNLFCNTDNSEAKLILYLYSFITNKSSLHSWSQTQYSKEHLEHVLPTAWKQHWGGWKNDKESIIETIEVYAGEMRAMSKSNLRASVESSDDVLLKEYVSRPKRTRECINEWIGNKFVLVGATNSELRNFNYKTKLNAYNRERVMKIPSIDDSLGFKSYPVWDDKTIVDRTITIVETICTELYSVQWDS